MSGLGLTGDLNIIACWEHDRPGTISPAQATPALLKSLRTSDYCVELVLVGNKSAWWISKNDKTQWKSHRFSFMAFAKPCSALIKNIDARYGVSRGCRQWGCDKMVNTKTNRMHAAKPDAMIALEEVRLSFQLWTSRSFPPSKLTFAILEISKAAKAKASGTPGTQTKEDHTRGRY